MKRVGRQQTPAVAARTRTTRKTATIKSGGTKSSREKVQAHRARMRKRGFRVVQMWLPDTRTEQFAEQAHKDSVAIRRSERDAQDQVWVDSISWWNSPEAAALEAHEPSGIWWRNDRPPK
jgi:hypothetical protein